MKAAPLACAALLTCGALAAPAAGQSYSDEDFEQALYGYLELGRDNYLGATHRLYEIGVELNSAGILRDAAFAAVSLQNFELARKAGEAWYTAGGGTDALQLLARLQITTKGLERSVGLLSHIAEDAGPGAVYQALAASDSLPAQLEAMRSAHPLHLRDGSFHAYMALLHLEAGNRNGVAAELAAGLDKEPAGLPLLVVAVFHSELAGDDVASISYAGRLAKAADTDVASAVMGYKEWQSRRIVHGQDRGRAAERVLLPGPEGFQQRKAFADRTRLEAGLFYLRHSDPGAALEILRTVPRNSPSWVQAVLAQVSALNLLDDKEQMQSLLATELESGPIDYVPEFMRIYLELLEEQEGPERAYEYLSGYQRGQDNYELLYTKFIYADRVDELEEAERAVRRLIELRPESADGYNGLGYMYADRNIKLDEALELILRALEIEPDSAAIIDSHGWVLFRMGDLDGARARIEEALRLMGDNPHVEILAHYGEILWHQNEREQAVNVWRSAWQRDSEDHYLRKTLERYAISP